MEENIIGLHVPVHDVVLVENLEGIEQLLEDEESFSLSELLLLGEQVLESAPIAIFVNEVEVVGCLEHVVVANDMLVRLNAAEDVYLVDRALLQLFVLSKASDWDDLDCVLLFVCVIYGPVNFAVDA
jgi:hypothetical protein